MDIKNNVVNNLITLRKKNNLTQIELAKKVNFSDKAISRWENGEVMPDIETLNVLANVYNVPISYFFETHENAEKPYNNNEELRKKLCLTFISILVVWTIISILFVYLQVFYDFIFWQVFIWGIPISCLVALYCNKRWIKNKTLRTILQSVFIWSLITSFYLQFLTLNLWLVYIIGVPIQATIIIGNYLKQ